MRSSYGNPPKARKLKLARVGSRYSGTQVGLARPRPTAVSQPSGYLLPAYKQLCPQLGEGLSQLHVATVTNRTKLAESHKAVSPHVERGRRGGMWGMPTSFSKKPETCESPLALISRLGTHGMSSRRAGGSPGSCSPASQGRQPTSVLRGRQVQLGVHVTPADPPWPYPV